MKKIAVIIDPWESFCSTWLFPLSSQYWLFKRIKRFINSRDDIEDVIVAAYENLPVDKEIMNWKNNKRMFYMTEEQDFKTYLSTNQVESIFMCGSAWEMCVENRPLGYTNLYKISKSLGISYDILVKDDCVIDVKGKPVIPDQLPQWVKTSERNIYQYISE